MFERFSSVILVTFLLLVFRGECQYGGAPPTESSNLPTGPTPISPPAESPPPPAPAPPAESPPPPAESPPPPAPAPPAPAPPPPAPAPPPPAPAPPPPAPAPPAESPPAESPPAESPPAPAPPASAPAVKDCKVTGMWYGVMSTEIQGDGPCNLFTNNAPPCQCIAAYFQPLIENSWQVYINTYNNQSKQLTVDMGGASTDDQVDYKSFTLSRAVMPLSTVTATQYTITDNVNGASNFMKYDMNVLGYSEENSYMITNITKTADADKTQETVIWCRHKFPNRNTIWRAIVVNLKALGINDHLLQFIKQDGCTYPSLNQYDNMFFCS